MWKERNIHADISEYDVSTEYDQFDVVYYTTYNWKSMMMDANYTIPATDWGSVEFYSALPHEVLDGLDAYSSGVSAWFEVDAADEGAYTMSIYNASALPLTIPQNSYMNIPTDYSLPRYFVSTQNSNVGNLPTGLPISNNYWKSFDDNLLNFDDVWTPAYGTSFDFEPKKQKFKFGDGYDQSYPKGLLYQLQNYNISFPGVTDAEARSLITFFEYKNGVESFNFRPYSIYKSRRCVAKNWNHVFVNMGLYNISAQFFEVNSN